MQALFDGIGSGLSCQRASVLGPEGAGSAGASQHSVLPPPRGSQCGPSSRGVAGHRSLPWIILWLAPSDPRSSRAGARGHRRGSTIRRGDHAAASAGNRPRGSTVTAAGSSDVDSDGCPSSIHEVVCEKRCSRRGRPPPHRRLKAPRGPRPASRVLGGSCRTRRRASRGRPSRSRAGWWPRRRPACRGPARESPSR